MTAGVAPGADPEPARARNAVVRFARLRSYVASRRFARTRRWLGFGLLCVTTLMVVGLDLSRRRARLVELDSTYRWTYAAAVLESLILWATLLYAASRRRGAARWVNGALFLVALTFTVGGQTYFYGQYNAYLNVDVSVFASNFKESVVNQLFADGMNYLFAKLPPLLAALALLWLGRGLIRPRRRWVRVAGALGPALLIASFFIPTQHRHAQASTPDVLYLNAVGGLIRTQLGLTEQSHQLRPRTRQSLPVPALSRRADAPARNVVLFILESVRADAVCVEHDRDCRLTRTTNLLVPARHPLLQMRSLTSSTAISLAVLWTGLLPTADRDSLHTWPLIFDYAKATGYDTAFWTSQNMMFGNARLWVQNLGVSSFTSATELEPTSDLDMGAPEGYLARYVKREIDRLVPPFLAVIQLSNVHYPYWVDGSLPMPFEPWTTSKAADDNPHFKNYYQNSVYQQDMHVAEMIRAIRNAPSGDETVIVYTSDHGEAFREHGQMGHTFGIYDEEIKVPAWIDAPQGTLTADEELALVNRRDSYLTHADIAPTILDLLGVKDDPGIARYRARMPGQSLIGPELPRAPLPATNCAGVWSCAWENWGYLDGPRKLSARSWELGYKCYDLDDDPFEHFDLGLARCADLVRLAQATYGRLPGEGIEKPDE